MVLLLFPLLWVLFVVLEHLLARLVSSSIFTPPPIYWNRLFMMGLFFNKSISIKTFFLAFHDKIQGRFAKAGRYNGNPDIQVDWLQIPKVIDDER